jgi:hypothetical protein
MMAVVTDKHHLRTSNRLSDRVEMKESFKPSTVSLKLGERRWMDQE